MAAPYPPQRRRVRERRLWPNFSSSLHRSVALRGHRRLLSDYPSGWIIEFNRTELEPRWAAWEPILMGAAAVAALLGLLVIWAALSFVYSIVAWIIAKIRKRLLSWPGSWAMCAAAIMPG